MRGLPPSQGMNVALFLMALIVSCCFAGPWLSPWNFDTIDFDGDWSAPPSWENGHWLGTDALGRDLFTRVLMGGRISLLVGVAGTVVSLLIGVLYGGIAGLIGGKLDAFMMRAVDTLYALPFLFLVTLLMVLFGRHLILVFVAIGCVNWLDMARMARGETLALMKRDFVTAAEVSGLSRAAILWRHVLPNLFGTVLVYATLTVPQVVLMESFLSFLGLGVQAPATSWGALISEGANDMETAPWALIVPSAMLVATLWSLNRIGDALAERTGRRR